MSGKSEPEMDCTYMQEEENATKGYCIGSWKKGLIIVLEIVHVGSGTTGSCRQEFIAFLLAESLSDILDI